MHYGSARPPATGRGRPKPAAGSDPAPAHCRDTERGTSTPRSAAGAFLFVICTEGIHIHDGQGEIPHRRHRALVAAGGHSEITRTVCALAATGSASTRLAIVRGNSDSGKSSVALAVRSHLGRTCAVVAQDVVRRTILKERDVPGGMNIGFISTIARYAIEAGLHVIVEGIRHGRESPRQRRYLPPGRLVRRVAAPARDAAASRRVRP